MLRPTSFVDKGFFAGLGLKKDGAFKKVNKVKALRKQETSKKAKSSSAKKDSAPSKGPTSPIYPQLRDVTVEPNAEEQDDPFDTIVCKHCKKTILKQTSKDHIAGCLKSKQEKARKKKEAREAALRAKERAERGDDEEDEDDDIKDGKRGKLANGDDAKSKKRKAEGEDDSKPNKKKKKEEQKPKAAKPKGPVDVERQCGVTLPNGQQCARSLTCKSHSMGAKRAVPGRSLPYDMLLAAYQKKNQARQQKAAIDANAPALFDDELDNITGPVDSDEERDAVMTSIQRSIARPQPLVTRTLFPTRRKYQLVRMKEMLSNAMSGNRSGGLFSVSSGNSGSAYPGSAANETFAIPSATPLTASTNMPQGIFRPPSRRESIDVA
ncbi:SAGA complex subunit Sgf73 [Knufia fluminis]|uniref:SAGA complex subunit Sgf73 n=1 Tax=Knufia fluminis TaxID=191047 RepID=A0AAN8I4H1_9EURO|nr:SAGA complex subunit Sgf73 [Knufia fluminis]